MWGLLEASHLLKRSLSLYQYFGQDEHVCIDDLIQHIGPASTIPLPGAFYGVSIFLFCFT